MFSFCIALIIILIGVYIIAYFKFPPIHLKITPNGYFVYYNRKESSPIHFGEKKELNCSIYRHETGWSSFCAWGNYPDEGFISYNDADIIEDFLKRHKLIH
jgi:hypothetical protein